MSNSAFEISFAVHLLFYAFLNQMSDALLSKTNGNITLTTNIKHQTIEEILWKFKGNKVVDWDAISGLTQYLQFKGRTSLFQTTGDLTILNLKSEDSGIYEAEVIIDGNIHSVKHNLTVIDPVSNLLITCRPDDSQTTTLHCQAEGAQLTYSWSGSGLNTEIRGQIGPNITKEVNKNSVYYCVVKNPVSEESKDFRAADCFPGETSSVQLVLGVVLLVLLVLVAIVAIAVYVLKKRHSRALSNPEGRHEETEDLLIENGHGHDRTEVSQLKDAQVHQNEDVDEAQERGEREIEKTPSPPPKVLPVVPLKPPKWSETKTSQVEMSESNDGETERVQAVGSLRAHKGESSTWKDVDKVAPPHERGERETETVPSAPPKVPPAVPPKPPKHSDVQCSDSAGDTDGREEREIDGDQTVEGSLLSHPGESSVSKEVENEDENESRERGETDPFLSPMSSPPDLPNRRPPIPPKPKDVPPCGLSDSSSLDSDLKAGRGTNITSLETTDSTSMPPPSNDTDPP